MKVLFAVNNENVSEAIVKKYQKNYKEIISYKNVYYFNAILKEIQKDKTYDRIVISEDLEQFTNTTYEQMDKFIFERLDSISDEASNMKGEDIPIILICTERRTKGEQALVKFFGIGLYNAIIGDDRSVDEVCRLINKPRLKKDAKAYYRIDSENVNYQPENENDVSEIEIQNIIAHFKRLGKNEAKYLDSFNSIAAQYNDNQLKVICKYLPLGVKAVLEEKSEKYQKVMAFNKSVSESLRRKKADEAKNGPSEKLLNTNRKKKPLSGPIVIPSAMKSADSAVKLTRSKPQQQPQPQMQPQMAQPQMQQQTEPQVTRSQVVQPQMIQPQVTRSATKQVATPVTPNVEEIQEEPIVTEPVVEKPKRGRGRPRKNQLPQEGTAPAPKKKRGRPRKNPLPEETAQEEDLTVPLPGTEEEPASTLPGIEVEEPVTTLPGMENETETFSMPGFEENDEEEIVLPEISTEETGTEAEPEYTLPGIDDRYKKIETPEPVVSVVPTPTLAPAPAPAQGPMPGPAMHQSYSNISSSIKANQKLVAFVGTSKNGTSFIVNNLAELLSSTGVDVAILDTTQNRNAYYIYTKNEENLRKVAMSSITNLVNGIAQGIKVNSNLTAYTSLPGEGLGIENVQAILGTLMKKHTVVLIDCDFKTPKEYFANAQEVYLVQTMDILTIQPLTAFLRDLMAQNALDEQKIRIIINKYVKMKGVSEKEIIGGMAYYNDPAMSFMTGLFDRNLVKYISIPFEEETYVKYLEGIVNCEISLKGYSRMFMQNLKQLGGMVYPVVSGRGSYKPPTPKYTPGYNPSFSNSMNDTLSQMKRNY